MRQECWPSDRPTLHALHKYQPFQISAPVHKGREQESTDRISRLVFSNQRADSADQIGEHLLGFPQALFIGSLCRNIIPVIKHVNGISPVNLQSFDQDIIERFQQRIVLQSAFPQRHQHLPDTARPLGCFRKTVFPQLLIRFRKRNFLGNRQIPGLFRTGQFQKMNVETAVILPPIRIATAIRTTKSAPASSSSSAPACLPD